MTWKEYVAKTPAQNNKVDDGAGGLKDQPFYFPIKDKGVFKTMFDIWIIDYSDFGGLPWINKGMVGIDWELYDVDAKTLDGSVKFTKITAKTVGVHGWDPTSIKMPKYEIW